MVEAAELLGVEVDDFLIVGLDKELEVVDEKFEVVDEKLEVVDKEIEVVEEKLEVVNPPKRDLSFVCDQCDFKTGDKYQLRNHVAAKHIGIMYDCDECEHQSAYKKNLKRHKRRAHKPPYTEEEEWKGEMEIKEREEYMEMENKDELVLKERSEGGDDGHFVKLKLSDPPKESEPETKPNLLNSQLVSYKCDQCIFKTQDKYHLKKHITAKHTGIRYDCDECDYQSAYKKSIKRHKWATHKTIVEPSFTCNLCDNKYPFHSQDHLRQHIMKHHKMAVE